MGNSRRWRHGELRSAEEAQGHIRWLRPGFQNPPAANFTGKGRWKSRLPDIIKALEALGRARRSAWTMGGGWDKLASCFRKENQQ